MWYRSWGQVKTTPRILVSNSAQGPDDSADTSGNDHMRSCSTRVAPRTATRSPAFFTPSQEEENIKGDDDDLEARHLPPMCDIFNRR